MGPSQFIGLDGSIVLANQKPRNPPRSMGNSVHMPNMDGCINALTTTCLGGPSQANTMVETLQNTWSSSSCADRQYIHRAMS